MDEGERSPPRVGVAEHGATAVVRAAGELDVATAPELSDQLDRVFEGRPPVSVVVVDLSAVEFLALAGVRVLLEGNQRARTEQKLFRVLVDRLHPVIDRAQHLGMLDGLVVLNDSDGRVLAAVEGVETVEDRRG